MSFPEKKCLFTYTDLINWEDDQQRHELIGGDHVMTPSPSYQHQRITFNLAMYLERYVVERGVGEIFLGPVDVILSDYDVLVPDIGFLSAEQTDAVQQGVVKQAPHLVIEILSPSTVLRDKGQKFKQYAMFGVKEYWIVDPESRCIEVFDMRRQKLIAKFSRDDRLNTPTFPDIEMEVSEIF